MAVINRTTLLNDILFWLPNNNTLSDEDIAKLFEKIITDVGDSDSNYDEILSKSLRSCALKNKRDAFVDSNSIKFQKVGDFTEGYYQDSVVAGWEAYIKELPSLCSSEFGYSFSSEGYSGVYINPGDTITILSSEEEDDIDIL